MVTEKVCQPQRHGAINRDGPPSPIVVTGPLPSGPRPPFSNSLPRKRVLIPKNFFLFLFEFTLSGGVGLNSSLRITPTYLHFSIGNVVEDYRMKEWITSKLTGFHEAQRSEIPVQRLVRQYLLRFS